jgi:hypothetical protein
MRVIQKEKTASTCALLADFALDVFSHHPYCPNLAPSDFHLLTQMKQFLGGTHTGSDEEVKKTAKGWFKGLAVDFYDAGIQELVTRYDKCLNHDRNYV